MRRARVLLLAGLACREPPAAPPSLRPETGATGSRVRYGAVSGYLARPVGSAPQAAEIWIEAAGTDELERMARRRASEDVLVMIVSSTTDLDATRSYVRGLIPVRASIPVCPGGQCP